MRVTNARGQALIESVLTLPLLILAFSAILILGYRGLVFYSVDTQLHEALVCLDDDSVYRCKAALEKSVRSLLLFNIPFSVELRRQGSFARGEVRVEFRNLMKHKDPMILRKEMSFPLRVSLR